MQEVQKTVILLLQHGVPRERNKRLVLKLTSTKNVRRCQIEHIRKLSQINGFMPQQEMKEMVEGVA